MKGILVKWDAAIVGDNPPTELLDPTQHPGCIEVLELNEGRDPEVIYRRNDNATDHDGRAVPR